MNRRLMAVISVAVGLGLLGPACNGYNDDGGGDATDGADGFVSVATGDTAGEWELFAEFANGEFTGCLRLDHFGEIEECGNPDDELLVFESGEGATFGAVAEGESLEFADDGDEVDLIDDRFFVVASEAEIQLGRG